MKEYHCKSFKPHRVCGSLTMQCDEVLLVDWWWKCHISFFPLKIVSPLIVFCLTSLPPPPYFKRIMGSYRVVQSDPVTFTHFPQWLLLVISYVIHSLKVRKPHGYHWCGQCYTISSQVQILVTSTRQLLHHHGHLLCAPLSQSHPACPP